MSLASPQANPGTRARWPKNKRFTSSQVSRKLCHLKKVEKNSTEVAQRPPPSASKCAEEQYTFCYLKCPHTSKSYRATEPRHLKERAAEPEKSTSQDHSEKRAESECETFCHPWSARKEHRSKLSQARGAPVASITNGRCCSPCETAGPGGA